jgi:hypothetical protein
MPQRMRCLCVFVQLKHEYTFNTPGMVAAMAPHPRGFLVASSNDKAGSPSLMILVLF